MLVSTTDPMRMTAGEINHELDLLDAKASMLNSQLIDAGRGHEMYSQTFAKADRVSLNFIKVHKRIEQLRQEIRARYGPGAPWRLPRGKGFGPRVKKGEASNE